MQPIGGYNLKKSIILFLILFIVFLSSSPAQAGYWKLSGDGEFREAMGYGGLNSFDSSHVDYSVTDTMNGKTTRLIFTWGTQPQIIRQDEVVPISVSYIFYGPPVRYGACQVKFNAGPIGSSYVADYTGSYDSVYLLQLYLNENSPPEGKLINTEYKTPASGTGDGHLQYVCIGQAVQLDVSFPYMWVEEDETPTPPVSQPSTNSKTLADGETWNVDGGLERDAGTVTMNVPGFGTLLAIGALGLVMLFRKRR